MQASYGGCQACRWCLTPPPGVLFNSTDDQNLQWGVGDCKDYCKGSECKCLKNQPPGSMVCYPIDFDSFPTGEISEPWQVVPDDPRDEIFYFHAVLAHGGVAVTLTLADACSGDSCAPPPPSAPLWRVGDRCLSCTDAAANHADAGNADIVPDWTLANTCELCNRPWRSTRRSRRLPPPFAPPQSPPSPCPPPLPSYPPPSLPPPSPLSPPLTPWTLILRQVSPSKFAAASKSDFLQNEDNPEANTFTNIGALDWSDERYREGGKYHFKAVWTSSTGAEQVVEWKQTSTPMESSPTGFEPMQVFDASRSNCAKLAGIGASGQTQCLVDGNGADDCWWNCFGAIDFLGGNNIPAHDRQKKKQSALYLFTTYEPPSPPPPSPLPSPPSPLLPSPSPPPPPSPPPSPLVTDPAACTLSQCCAVLYRGPRGVSASPCPSSALHHGATREALSFKQTRSVAQFGSTGSASQAPTRPSTPSSTRRCQAAPPLWAHTWIPHAAHRRPRPHHRHLRHYCRHRRRRRRHHRHHRHRRQT